MTSIYNNSLSSLYGTKSYSNLGALDYSNPSLGYGSGLSSLSRYSNSYDDDYYSSSRLGYNKTSAIQARKIALLEAELAKAKEKSDTGLFGFPKLGDFDTGSGLLGGVGGLLISKLFGGKDGGGLGDIFGNLFG